MDTIETIILTSIVNIIITGLVGGIVIYRIQKKIDATNQKSFLEYQTKFLKTHEKRIEVLENLYQRFLTFTAYMQEFIGIVRSLRAKNLSVDMETCTNRSQKLDDMLHETRMYFEYNRLHLSDIAIEEVETTYRQNRTVHSLLTAIVRDYLGETSLPADLVIEFVKETAREPNDKDSNLGGLQNIDTLLDTADIITYLVNRRLEIVYKSVADTVPVDLVWRQP